MEMVENSAAVKSSEEKMFSLRVMRNWGLVNSTRTSVKTWKPKNPELRLPIMLKERPLTEEEWKI